MARNVWRDISRLTTRVDQHDKDIDDLLTMSTADHKRLLLQEESVGLLRKLGEVHAKRITMVERDVRRIRGRASRMLRQKYR